MKAAQANIWKSREMEQKNKEKNRGKKEGENRTVKKTALVE